MPCATSSRSCASGSRRRTCSCTAGLFHLLFNMLALWMFGTELERLWGTPLLPEVLLRVRHRRRGAHRPLLLAAVRASPTSCADSIVIGASGAIYGLLLAYGLYFPHRPILMFMLFPIPAKYFVMIIGAIAFYSSLGATGGVASVTHLGGLVVGYLYLKGARVDPLSELKYRYLKWKINRVRRKFDVYSGGRANDLRSTSPLSYTRQPWQFPARPAIAGFSSLSRFSSSAPASAPSSIRCCGCGCSDGCSASRSTRRAPSGPRSWRAWRSAATWPASPATASAIH